jgi:hypothetical protein
MPSNITSTQLNRNADIKNSKKLETGPSAALEKMGAVEWRKVDTKYAQTLTTKDRN